MRFTVFTLAMFFTSGCFLKQIQNNEQFSNKESLKIADQLFERKSYYNAVEFYLKAIESQPKDLYLMNQIAETYYLARDYKNAEIWYKKVIDIDPKKYPSAPFQYAQVLKMNMKYEEAKKVISTYVSEFCTPKSQQYNEMVTNELEACDFALKELKNPSPVQITNLSSPVNAAYTDYAPMPVGDSLLYFSSLYSDSVIQVSKKGDTKQMSRIYQVKKVNNEYMHKTTLPDIINDDESHTGNCTFSVDKTKLYFTRCKQNELKKVICSIFISQLKDGQWQTPVMLGTNINVPEYTCTHPTIGLNQKGAEILYFSSDRPGGKGGMDLWYSVINKKGEYAAPINLKVNINTSRDEITPYYDRKSQSLYFSSNGHVGLGGFDIYKSQGMLKKWTSPENIGFPINSSVDDMYFVPLDNENRGYLVSNRPGSIALKSETCCDDIYWFELKNAINIAVQGYVYDEADTTHTPLDNATVTLFLEDKESTSPIDIASDISNNNDMYFFNLSINKNYMLSATKQGYFSGKELFREYITASTKGIIESDTLKVDLYLKKMKINVAYRLQNIYYDFDKATLRPESQNTLDSLLVLLEDHSTIKIELSSHTDSHGTNPYNISLSQRRAESVVKYLIANGIPIVRLVAKGYGEEVPIAPNANADGSDNPDGRQLNRRTEFKIIGDIGNVEYVKPGQELY